MLLLAPVAYDLDDTITIASTLIIMGISNDISLATALMVPRSARTRNSFTYSPEELTMQEEDVIK